MLTRILKLILGNSAGTVTTYYLPSQGQAHDEIDFEFLGNLSGNPYIVHTNVFTHGKGDREQQFYLRFDTTIDLHTYSILWNPQHILFLVDEVPIREFVKKGIDGGGIPEQAGDESVLYSRLWNTDDWGTMGGRVMMDWSNSPFVTS